MIALSHAKMKLFGILAAAALALCVLPATAFAAQIDIYADNDSAQTSTLIASVDTANITGSVDFKGQYLKGGVWNVVQGNNCMTLDDFLTMHASSQWGTNTYVTFDTVDYPNGYDKYNNGVFTRAELTAEGYFYGETMYNSTLPLPGTGSNKGPAVLARTWGKQAQGVGESADYVANNITPTDHTYPCLISGFTSNSPTAVGGNRFPAKITAIHLHN